MRIAVAGFSGIWVVLDVTWKTAQGTVALVSNGLLVVNLRMSQILELIRVEHGEPISG